jgi:hypothetical protein
MVLKRYFYEKNAIRVNVDWQGEQVEVRATDLTGRPSEILSCQASY